MISFGGSGDFSKTKEFLRWLKNGDLLKSLDRYGQEGVDALSRATPLKSGKTAVSWKYRIIRKKNRISIEWYNTFREHGVPVAVLIQYGHGTRHGGYVHGRDFINPAIRPVFDRIANEVWKKVTEYGATS